MTAFYVPETKGRTFEQITASFKSDPNPDSTSNSGSDDTAGIINPAGEINPAGIINPAYQKPEDTKATQDHSLKPGLSNLFGMIMMKERPHEPYARSVDFFPKPKATNCEHCAERTDSFSFLIKQMNKVEPPLRCVPNHNVSSSLQIGNKLFHIKALLDSRAQPTDVTEVDDIIHVRFHFLKEYLELTVMKPSRPYKVHSGNNLLHNIIHFHCF
ncbi:hypothetical protein BSL78_02032 [Apostichopus japonicus]|uniref:Uncharacterized protein n=1 Tax=Stichopus japonicus TaxID=307972 RepID=A0A2G8LLA7_STIJA|nr:hypothetical protein BSL78_02032 [Apostichopus japonicus]